MLVYDAYMDAGTPDAVPESDWYKIKNLLLLVVCIVVVTGVIIVSAAMFAITRNSSNSINKEDEAKNHKIQKFRAISLP